MSNQTKPIGAGKRITAASAENTGREQKPQLFKQGQSGNPSGRPVGARNRATLAMESLLDGEAEAITSKAIELAKKGDGPALRLCMERIMPARRDRPTRSSKGPPTLSRPMPLSLNAWQPANSRPQKQVSWRSWSRALFAQLRSQTFRTVWRSWKPGLAIGDARC